MSLSRCLMMISMGAVAIAAVVSRDSGDLLAGDVNGDNRVDVLDLQAMAAKVLHAVKMPDANELSGNRPVNVLDFQRALAHTRQTNPRQNDPPAKPVCKVCFFCYQTGWMVEPAEQKAESVEDVSPEPSLPKFDRPDRCIIPTLTERYLFRLTPNAPPAYA